MLFEAPKPGTDVVIKAKFLRAELRAKYPGVKFSVRISRFSMGSSIYVHYDQGPRLKEVEQIVGKYQHVYAWQPEVDYFHVDNYASAQKNLTNERADELRKSLLKFFSGYEKDSDADYDLWAAHLEIDDRFPFEAQKGNIALAINKSNWYDGRKERRLKA